jgi:hypothetical protein
MAKKKKKNLLTYAACAALGLTFTGEHLSMKSEQGKDRWEVKVLADDQASDISFIPEKTTLGRLTRLSTKKSKDGNPRQPAEMKTYTIECRINKFLYEDDGDIHLVLEDSGQTMIGEIPFPYYKAADESGFKKKFIRVRRQFHGLTDTDPGYSHRTFLVTGVGFVDFPHGQTGHADNNLELHPILNIEPKK